MTNRSPSSLVNGIKFRTVALVILIVITTFMSVSHGGLASPANSIVPVDVASTTSNTIVTNSTSSTTTMIPQLNASYRVDRWDWSTWNTMSGLALWITNMATEPLDIFSLTVTIGGLPTATTLYPGPAHTCPLTPILPQSQCLMMPTPSFAPTTGNSYPVQIASPDGTITSLNATYGARSDNPQQFTIDAMSWTATCCSYSLNLEITNTGATVLDTYQIANLVTLNGASSTSFSACGSITLGSKCDLLFHIDSLTSYVVVVVDATYGNRVYLLTPG